MSERNDKPSYLLEMLRSQTNFYAFLSTMAVSAVMAIPYGASGAILPAIAFVAGEVIAATMIPSSPTFRAKVDKALLEKKRIERMNQLRAEISRHDAGTHANWQVLAQLQDRISAVLASAGQQQTPIPDRDLARLEDAPVDFLGLWLARLTIAARQDSVDEDHLVRQIAQIDQQIQAGGGDQNSLLKARSDLEELRQRHLRLAGRKAAVDAAILSLPDAVEEIYQAVIALPGFNEGGGRLQEAIDRLRMEEALGSSYEMELREPPRAATQRVASKVAR